MGLPTWVQTVASQRGDVTVESGIFTKSTIAADKCPLPYQYIAMHFTCPHCQTHYDIDSDIGSDISESTYTCHRCGGEFTPHKAVQDLSTQDQPADDVLILEQPEYAPVRQRSSLWPWLLVMLMLLISGSFWLQNDTWMNNLWFRSQLQSMGIQLPLRDIDWHIEPASVHTRWLKRDTGDKVLMLQGTINNRLSLAMPLPRIRITFFSAEAPDTPLQSSIIHIIRPTTEHAIQTAAFLNPAWDLSSVPANSPYRFMILVQHVPENMADFSITPTRFD